MAVQRDGKRVGNTAQLPASAHVYADETARWPNYPSLHKVKRDNPFLYRCVSMTPPDMSVCRATTAPSNNLLIALCSA